MVQLQPPAPASFSLSAPRAGHGSSMASHAAPQPPVILGHLLLLVSCLWCALPLCLPNPILCSNPTPAVSSQGLPRELGAVPVSPELSVSALVCSASHTSLQGPHQTVGPLTAQPHLIWRFVRDWHPGGAPACWLSGESCMTWFP